MKNKNIGLIGYGTIGQFIAKKVNKDPSLNLEFVSDCFYKGEYHLDAPLLDKIDDYDFSEVDIVVETANADVVKKYADCVLRNSDFLIFSLTALADIYFYENLMKLSKKYGRRIFVPHGAILGLDGISDGRETIENVKIVTTKNPKGFGRSDKEKAIIYEGSTRGACMKYPRNVNVHAAIALAGLGFDDTTSVIISDPDVQSNTHEIFVQGIGFDFCTKVSSNSSGLVTGVYTPISAYGSLDRSTTQKSGIIFV